MATVEQQIAVRIRAIVSGLSQVQALSASVKDLSRIRSTGLNRTATDAGLLARNANLAVRSVAPLFATVKDLSGAFATGQLNIKNFASELGNAARKIKPITDAARLLGPATGSIATQVGSGGGIALPAKNPNLITLKPLIADTAKVNEGITATVRNVARLTTGTKEAKDAIAQLADQWIKGDTITRKGIEGLLKSFDTVRVARFNALIGAQSSTTPTSPGKAAKDTATEVRKAAASTRTLTQQFNSATSSVFRLRAAVALVAAAIAALAAAGGIYLLARGIGEVIQEGIRFNQVLEDARIGLAAIISNNFDIRDAQGQLLSGVDAYQAGLALAEQQMQKIRKATIETAFEFEDLLAALVAASSAVAGTNTDLDKTVDLVVKASRAASAIGLGPKEFATQIRQVLTGATRVQTRLAQALFPGQNATQINEQIKSFRQAGTLVQELENRLQAFQFIANDIVNTFTALANNVGDAFKTFAGAATLELFERVKDTLRFILSQVVDLSGEGVKLSPTFQKLANIFNIIAGQLGSKLLGVVRDIFGWLERWVGSMSASEGTLRGIADAVFEIGRQIVGWVSDLLSFLTVSDSVNITAGNILTAFRFIAVYIATIRDLTRIWHGLFQMIASGPLLVVTGAFELIVSLIERAVGSTNRLSSAIGQVRQNLQAIYTGGASKIVSGARGDSRNDATNTLLFTRGVSAGADLGSGEFSSSPRAVGSSGESAGSKARREALRSRKQLLDALGKLQEAAARRDLDLVKDTNDSLRQINQQLYDDNLKAVQDFQFEKFRLDRADIEAEKKFLAEKKRIAQGSLQREVGNVFGADSVSVDRLNDLTKLAAGDVSKLSKQQSEAVKLIIDFKREELEIDTEIQQLGIKELQLNRENNAEIARGLRTRKQMLGDIEAELADSIGQGGVSSTNALGKRISDEFGRVLLDTNAITPEIEVLAEQIREMGTIDLDLLTGAMNFLGIEVKSLSPETQKLIQLFKRLQASAKFEGLTSEIDNGFGRLSRVTEQVEADFGSGKTGLEDALDRIRSAKGDEIPAITSGIQRLRELMKPVIGQSLFSEEERAAVEAYLRAVEAATQGVVEFGLASENSRRGQDTADAKLDEIAIKRRAGTINQIEAEDQMIAAKQRLIEVLEIELALLQAAATLTPEQTQRAIELTNQIGQLRNEQNASMLDFKEGVEGSIAGAFQSFFDSVLSGNQSILDSFRQVVSQMLIEIGKLIFQAFVLKQVMSLVQGFIGGIGGSSGGSGGGGGFSPSGPFGMGANFAEGGYTGDGPTMAPAGIVHRGEYVVPKSIVSRPGMLGYLHQLKSGAFLPKLRGYASGGLVGDASSSGGAARGGGNVRIVNVLDKSIFSDFLNSSEGEQIITNLMSKNSQMLTRMG